MDLSTELIPVCPDYWGCHVFHAAQEGRWQMETVGSSKIRSRQSLTESGK
jgi:hypothetical protein